LTAASAVPQQRDVNATKLRYIDGAPAAVAWPLHTPGPMPFTLDQREQDAVRRIIDKYLQELDYEIARIDLQRDRTELLDLEHTLRSLRGRLAIATRG
jgi:hypothetical protein